MSVKDNTENLRNAVIGHFAEELEIPSMNDIRSLTERLANAFQYDVDIDQIAKEVNASINCTMEPGKALTGIDEAHDKNWVERITKAEKIYATKYEKYLIKKGMPKNIVTAISESNEQILGLLGDPKGKSSFQRRGLVIGDVQSGKTSNYLSLITKAADAGYKFIIVIAGIHNNLRKQTQQRIDEGFVGTESHYMSRIEDRKKIGVGLNEALRPDVNYPFPISYTTQEEDFNRQKASTLRSDIKDLPKPVILVIKKHTSTLTSLESWLKANNTTFGSSISEPMLMIDDESDNASINTNKAEDDPTRTNALLRRILKLFEKSCYVGFTATPFANIFIDPDAYDEDSFKDLFPKDFIYYLNSPPNYFGPKKIFLGKDDEIEEETEGNDYGDTIVALDNDEVKKWFPEGHKKTLIVKGLPESLKRAILTFLITKAIRNIRGQSGEHCSMLINVSTFVNVQSQIQGHVQTFLKEVGDELEINGFINHDGSEIINILKSIYLEEFHSERHRFDEYYPEWEELRDQLVTIFSYAPKDYVRGVEVFTVNSESQVPLDYSEYSRRGLGLTAVVIGGFSLSRGLTIEGLTTSYFYRSTKMYDTLLQMGRWFGYRQNYEDLCRIYMTRKAFLWYEHITRSVEDLKKQVAEMGQNNRTPTDFGLYVRSSDDGLLVTARNKSRSTEPFVVKKSFSGELKELYLLTTDMDIQEKNYKLFGHLWNALETDGKRVPCKSTSAETFVNVKTEKVLDFLHQFDSGYSGEPTSVILALNNAIKYLSEIRASHPESDITFITKEKPNNIHGFAQLKPIIRSTNIIDNSLVLNRSRLGGQDDEKHGLTDIDLEELKNEHSLGSKKSNKAAKYRKKRNKPLLLLYLVEPKFVAQEGDISFYGKGIPTLAISFPYGDEQKEIVILANEVYTNQLTEEYFKNYIGDDYV